MSDAVSPPTVVVAGALIDPTWLGPTAWDEALRAPGWHSVLRRVHAPAMHQDAGTLRHPRAAGHERWLHRAWGLAADHALAALCAGHEGAPAAAWRLDLVHCHVGRDRIILSPPHVAVPEAAEAAALAAAIAPTLSEAGLAVQQATPQRWYLTEINSQPPWRLHTGSLHAAVGQPIDAWLPEGPDARRWRRVFNEIQMIWFDHPVNQARAARGVLPINAVWLEGRTPPTCPPEWPSMAAHWLTTADEPDVALTCPVAPHWHLDTRLWRAHLSGDPHTWLKAWQTLDQDLFARLGAEARYAAPMTLVLGGATQWRQLSLGPTRASPWQRLRRPRRAATLDRLGAAWLSPLAAA